MSPTTEKLLPCPFCGEVSSLYVEHLLGTVLHPAFRVRCDNCGASTGYTDKDHAATWNRRATRAVAEGGEESFHDRFYSMKFSLFLDADGEDETKVDLTCGATIGEEALFHVTDGSVLAFRTAVAAGAGEKGG